MPLLPLLFLAAASAQSQAPTESLLGSLAGPAKALQADRGFSYEFARKGSLSPEQWRKRGRAKTLESLGFAPSAAPLDLKVHATEKRDGFEIRTISYAGTAHYRIPAYLLVPAARASKRPAVVALHDHGGWFFHGKEKLVSFPTEHGSLAKFRQQYYGGRAYAETLAREGFIVLVPDAFYWGERRIQYETPPPALRDSLQNLDPASEQYVAAHNRYLRERVNELNTWLGFSGLNWLGIVSFDDRRAVDLLTSLPEVDPARIGCLGLSGGGFRSTYLAGTDSRIRAAVITGWMVSLPTVMDTPYSVHSGLFDAPGLHAFLDHPDVASLAAPDSSIFIQQCRQDRLFTVAGMQSASAKIEKVFQALKRGDHFQSKFYDNPHAFTLQMQADAFAWLSRWLKP